jgi:hypothetical protein
MSDPVERSRLQISLSPKLREWLEEQAELRGQPLASVATHLLADVMIQDKRQTSYRHDPTDPTD